MNISDWGPSISISGLNAEDYNLSNYNRSALGIITLVRPCGFLLTAENQIILHNKQNSIFRTIEADLIFSHDYRKPLRMILDTNIDLLDGDQILFLRATWTIVG